MAIMSQKPSVLIMLTPRLYSTLFVPESDAALRDIATVTCNTEERNWSSTELAERLPGYDAVITGWGSPLFSPEVVAAGDRLKLIAHSAGSIKGILPPAVLEKGIAVTHAAPAIAPAVAEMSLLLVLLCLRQVHRHDRSLKAGEPWGATQAFATGQELAGQRVGVIGAGYTGRCFIQLLRAIGCEIWVCDPYLSPESAAELGVVSKGLHELLAGCRIVSVQLPSTSETRHIIGARELALLQDGALFINTARSWSVDQAALLSQLQTGRFQAGLDVFDDEPLPEDSPFRKLANTVITPHIAGGTWQARHRQGATMVAELRRFFTGEPLRHRVTRDMLEIMA